MKTRQIAPFGLRMPPELKDRLEKAAGLAGRSANAEIVARLWNSLGETEKEGSLPHPLSLMQSKPPGYLEAMPDIDRAMLLLWRRWPPEKQLAFLSLFK